MSIDDCEDVDVCVPAEVQTSKKKYLVYAGSYGSAGTYPDYDSAVKAAKRLMEKRKYDKIDIFEAIAFVQAPVPEYEVTKY